MLDKHEKKDRRTNVEKEIDAILEEMRKLREEEMFTQQEYFDEDGNVIRREDVVNPCYVELNKRLTELYKMKEIDKKAGLNPNTVVTVGGSFLSILGILIFEKTDFLATKALGFVIRGRV